MDINDVANKNLENHLRRNIYPGRGFVVGRSTHAEAWLMLYWVMGRSANSRNRRFVVESGGKLRTEPVDASLVSDPTLIIYDAMLELPGLYLVSNGDQTRTLYDTLESGGSFEDALALREREPDAPNYTPRISGLLDLRNSVPVLAFSILKANPFDSQLTDRFIYRPAPPPVGFGLGLTTYTGDGNPLPSFSGDPLPLPLTGSAEAILETYWQALDPANRIALALKYIPITGGPGKILTRNRFA